GLKCRLDPKPFELGIQQLFVLALQFSEMMADIPIQIRNQQRGVPTQPSIIVSRSAFCGNLLQVVERTLNGSLPRNASQDNVIGLRVAAQIESKLGRLAFFQMNVKDFNLIAQIEVLVSV